VAEVVEKQLAVGLDVVDDGEMSKPSFVTYVQERLAGFKVVGEPAGFPWAGSREVPGHDAVRVDIETLKAALGGRDVADAFLPAISPSNIEGR
jgi:5-methyltetrahydropteroyltriglutamate--homocysteine methyltransferase